MGTNYYLHEKPCSECGRSDRLHIGKSSGGWCFSLHIIPDQGINDLVDWLPHFLNTDKYIMDEYGKRVSVEDTLRVITCRERVGPVPDYFTDAFYDRNHADPGPAGLLVARIDNFHCTGHGAGTWSLHPGEFS